MRLRPERLTLVAVLFLLFGAMPLGLSSWWLSPALLAPVVALVWVLRARVVGTVEGLRVCNGLGVHQVPWDEVAGFQVPRRGPVRLLRHGKRPLPMTALTRHDLPRLLEMSPVES